MRLLKLRERGAELAQANGSEGSSYDHFQTSSSHIPAPSSLNSQPPLYQDALSMGGAGFFPSQSGFQQPVSNLSLSEHSRVWGPESYLNSSNRTLYVGTISPVCPGRAPQPKSSRLSTQRP